MDPIYLESADGFRQCPYNPTHVIGSVRFIGHLLKCSKSSGKRFQICPWNAQHHIVEPANYEVHLTTCIFRTYLDVKPPKMTPSPEVSPLKRAVADIPPNVTDNGYSEIATLKLSEKSALGHILAENNYSDMIESNEEHTRGRIGIYGDIEEVHNGIGAIVDAFAASSFSKSANGLAILQKLVDTIYEEAEIMAG